MKAQAIDNDRRNISEVHNKYSSAWCVRLNLNGIKSSKSFAFNPNLKKDREAALSQAKYWRDDEWESITRKSVSTETTKNLKLRTLLEEYLANETPLKKPSGAATETTRINRMLNDTVELRLKLIHLTQ